MDTFGNIDNAVSIDGCWMYDFNYKRALNLMNELLDLICNPSKDDDEIYAEFRMLYYAARYVNLEANFYL